MNRLLSKKEIEIKIENLKKQWTESKLIYEKENYMKDINKYKQILEELNKKGE